MKKLSYELLSKNIKSIRSKNKMTLEQLAIKTGIHRSMISRIEKMDYKPSLNQLEKLAEVLEFEIVDLFVEDKDNTKLSLPGYKVAVAEMGYVGLSIAVLLAQHNHVTAVDIIEEKVDLIKDKKSPIKDEYIERYLAEKNLDLVATLDGEQAYKEADFVIIATPTNYDSKKKFF